MADPSTPEARASWLAATKRTFDGIVDGHGGLTSAQIQGLYSACDLLDEADRMQKVVKEDGRVVEGSQGQPVAHPLVAEVRQYRRAANDTIRALGLDGRSASSAAASALANKRWASKPPGGATVTPLRGRA